MKNYIVFLLSVVLIVSSCGQQVEENTELEKIFEDHSIKGSFLLYDLNTDSYLSYDSQRCEEQFIPASTYKIFNALVALETGVATDENFFLPWDGVTRFLESWNSDHDFKTAMKNSTVWYFQELARRIGEERMKEYVEKSGYGNRDISGGIDSFWLTGGLRISQFEQIELLRNLYLNKMLFSLRSMNIVKEMIKVETGPDYILRAKTGSGEQDGKVIGWYVGYLEKDENVYFFATNIETSEMDYGVISSARIDITREILKELGLL